MRRIAAIALVGMLAATAVHAGEIPGSATMVAGWRLSAFENGGKFSHCNIQMSYPNGILLAFAASGDASWRIGIGSPNARFTVGASAPAELYVDGAGPHRATFVARTPTLFLAEISADSQLFGALRNGNQLTVASPEGRQAFSLAGTNAALLQIAVCVQRYGGIQSAGKPAPGAPPPAPAAPSAGQVQPRQQQAGVQEIAFRQFENTAEVVRTYPFLKQSIEDMLGSIKSSPSKVEMLIAEAQDPLRGTRFVFLRSEGLLWCGTSGCGTEVFADEGSGYKKAFSAIVPAPIFLLSKDGSTALVFCNLGGGPSPMWSFRNHVFAHVGPFNGANTCP